MNTEPEPLEAEASSPCMVGQCRHNDCIGGCQCGSDHKRRKYVDAPPVSWQAISLQERQYPCHGCPADYGDNKKPKPIFRRCLSLPSYISNPSSKYQCAVKALQSLALSESLDAAERAFAEAAADLKRAAFITRHAAKRSTAAPSLRSLAAPGTGKGYIGIPEGDHLKAWSMAGKTSMVTSEPYGLRLDSLREMVMIADKHHIDINISASQSMHFPGMNLVVMFTKAEEDRQET